MSDNNSDGNGGVDDSICTVCDETTYVGETISCETCEYWFHFDCVGVSHEDEVVQSEDVPFYCPKCAPPPKGKKISKKVPNSLSSTKKKGGGSPSSSSTSTSSAAAAAAAAANAAKGVKLKISVKSSGSSGSEDNPAKKRRKRDNKTEEEQWLDAVEAGTLNEVVDPELKNIKDPKLMTARQRAMAERQRYNTSGLDYEEGTEHVSLDYGFKSKSDDEESLKQKAIKSAKRKEMELEKREQDKKKTMDRLLKKKDSKTTKQIKSARGGSSFNRKGAPVVTYKIHKDGTRTLSLPPGMDYPIKPRIKKEAGKEDDEPPKITPCAVCKANVKIYSCSKTGKPLCSLACYKRNLESSSSSSPSGVLATPA